MGTVGPGPGWRTCLLEQSQLAELGWSSTLKRRAFVFSSVVLSDLCGLFPTQRRQLCLVVAGGRTSQEFLWRAVINEAEKRYSLSHEVRQREWNGREGFPFSVRAGGWTAGKLGTSLDFLRPPVVHANVLPRERALDHPVMCPARGKATVQVGVGEQLLLKHGGRGQGVSNGRLGARSCLIWFYTHGRADVFIPAHQQRELSEGHTAGLPAYPLRAPTEGTH